MIFLIETLTISLKAETGNFMVKAAEAGIAGRRDTTQGMMWFFAGDRPAVSSMNSIQLDALAGGLANERTVNFTTGSQARLLNERLNEGNYSAIAPFSYDLVKTALLALDATIRSGVDPLVVSG